MFIRGLGTAVPERRYAQRECWDFAKSHPQIARLTPRSQALLRTILLGDNGVAFRYLALASLEEVFELDPDALQRRFTSNAPALAQAAGLRALQNAEIGPGELDALL